MADFGGRLPSGEAVDKKLAASRAGSRTGERLELQSEFFRVVGEGRELSLAQHDAAAVGFGRCADATQFIFYVTTCASPRIARWASRICGRAIAKSFFCAAENPLAVMRTW